MAGIIISLKKMMMTKNRALELLLWFYFVIWTNAPQIPIGVHGVRGQNVVKIVVGVAKRENVLAK